MTTALVKRPPSQTSVLQLVELLVEAEKRLACGPWDNWDERVLVEWRDSARRRLNEALAELPWIPS